MNVTLKDVARHANVSVSTVSRVLNNKASISEETIERVENAVKELMYKPSGTITRLSGVVHTIAVVIPDKNEFYNNDPTTSIDINSIISEIERSGHKAIVTSLVATDALDIMVKRQVDGVIVCDSGDYHELKAICKEVNIPVLYTNGVIYNSMQNYVDYDNFNGAHQAISHLLSLGHRNIGIISGPETHQVCKNRMEGVFKAYHDHQLHMPQDVVHVPFSFDGGSQGAMQLLNKNADLTALFCFSDFIALGALMHLKSVGLSVPENISLVGFDDMEIGKVINPALTTVARFRSDISPLIVRSMTDLLDMTSISRVQILLETTLIIRDSCKSL